MVKYVLLWHNTLTSKIQNSKKINLLYAYATNDIFLLMISEYLQQNDLDETLSFWVEVTIFDDENEPLSCWNGKFSYKRIIILIWFNYAKIIGVNLRRTMSFFNGFIKQKIKKKKNEKMLKIFSNYNIFI